MKTKEIFFSKEATKSAEMAAMLKETSDIYIKENSLLLCINIYIKINGYFIFSQIYIALHLGN